VIKMKLSKNEKGFRSKASKPFRKSEAFSKSLEKTKSFQKNKEKSTRLQRLTEYKLKKEDIHRLINYATKVPSHAVALKSEVKKNILKAVLAAFAFVIALVWRDAIRAGVTEITTKLGIEGTGYIYQLTTAILVTIICVIGIMAVSRAKSKEDVKK